MKQLKDEMAMYLEKEQINKLVRKLADEIKDDYSGEEITLVCPLKGSIHFLADLSRAINLPQKIDFVDLRASKKGGTIKILKDISTDIQGKNVLIVEEIIDTGRTLNFLKTRLLSANPNSLKIVTLLDKPARRELPLRPDFIGITIEDRFVVGYGMDSDHAGRNYSDIYHLKN